MSDLIDRQAAIDALDEIEAEVADGYGYQYAKWREYFAKMPAVDAVEVVRCRDCVHYYPTYCEIWSKFGTVQTSPDGYCYEAERREGET